MTRIDYRKCDRCQKEFKNQAGFMEMSIQERREYEYISPLVSVITLRYDLCPLCAEAFRAFMDEMKPDPAACLPDDPMEVLENWLDDQSDMMDDILEGMNI